MTTLIGAALDAPLMAVLRRWPNRLHAVDMEHVVKGWDRGSYLSACGLQGVRLVGVDVDEVTVVAPWPPRLRGLPAGRVRCRDCWEVTGRMRPRTEWKPKELKGGGPT